MYNTTRGYLNSPIGAEVAQPWPQRVDRSDLGLEPHLNGAARTALSTSQNAVSDRVIAGQARFPKRT